MSMLSSKCDELRHAADELQNVIYNYRCQGFVGTLHYAQHGLRDAADIIWELRNKLAGVVDQQDEIARLRSCLSDDAENARQIMAENAKLRELLKDYLNAPCVECDPWSEGWQGCKHCDGGNCTLATRAFELRIEVEE